MGAATLVAVPTPASSPRPHPSLWSRATLVRDLPGPHTRQLCPGSELASPNE